MKRLNKGGMGQLYLAHDLSQKNVCVVKNTLKTDAAGIAQFRREAKLLCQLSHPNLPRVFDYVEESGNFCLVMEYIPGDDLAEWLQRHGPAPEALLLNWADQILAALEYLHSRQPAILHRDIKPANLKLHDNVVKLVDFGIARTWEGTGDQTLTGARAISPPYSPWEQYGQGGGTGPYSDIYALGATLYNLLTNTFPPEPTHRMERERDTLRPLSQLRPDLHPQTVRVIERALAIRREDRWQSARHMRQALRGRDHSTTPPPFRPTSKPVPPTSDSFLWFMGGLAVLLILCILSSGGNNRLPAPTVEMVVAETETITVTATIAILPTQLADSVVSVPTTIELPTITPTPTFTPIPTTRRIIVPTATPAPQVVGTIILLEPVEGTTLVTGRPSNFKWQWSGEELPPNHDFHVLIYPATSPDHFGAYDVKEKLTKPNGNQQYTVSFDPDSAQCKAECLYSVAVVKIEPYQIIMESAPRKVVVTVPGGGGSSGGGEPAKPNPVPARKK